MAHYPEIHIGPEVAVPPVGQGTWFLGDDPTARAEQIAALRIGVELGLRVIDTAEMYGDGRSEDLVGEAIAPVREQVYLVDKVLPMNASRSGTIKACERSLEQLGTDWIDLYLLHWPGPHPVEETIEAFESLLERGLIGAWGISNFDTDELEQFAQPPAVNQVLYNPLRRGIEFDLLPTMRAMEPSVPAMAYSPIEQGQLLNDPTLGQLARELHASPAQVLIAWAIRGGNVIAIPKASTVEHVRQNAAALELSLDASQLARIDASFPPPTRKIPLEVI